MALFLFALPVLAPWWRRIRRTPGGTPPRTVPVSADSTSWGGGQIPWMCPPGDGLRAAHAPIQCVSVTAAACAAVSALALGALAVALATPEALLVLIVLGAAQAAVVVVATLFILSPPPSDRLPPE